MQPEITLPPSHNKRAPAQWSIITQHVDFRGKTVLDLGCGYADLLWRCLQAGATSVVGVDSNLDITQHNNRILREQTTTLPAHFAYKDIGGFIAGYDAVEIEDVVLCFSVLPYLNDIMGTLEWICERSRLAFIECQYFGDGPGLLHVKHDVHMETLLTSAGWGQESVTYIGSTYIPDRDRHRTIWLCENKEIP